jgi:hypothetical protein
MSNIGKTSANIKKKLSLGDYDKPASQPKNRPVQKQTGKLVKKQPSKASKQQAGITASRPTDMSAEHTTVVPVSPQADVSVYQHTSVTTEKTKATYYLGKRELEMLTDMYIDQLRNQGKADRSALICEAIRLLYSKRK